MLLRANYLVFTSTLLIQAYGSALAPVILPRATVCNGHATLCDRSYGNVSYVGAHNSYAIGTNTLSANQDQKVVQQLNDGIRLLQLQALNQNGTIKLCHTLCSFYDGGTLKDYLSIVKTWLDANPNEVLTLLIVNINNLASTAFGDVFESVGLDTISYAPPTAIVRVFDWPTLGAMIDSGKRLVTFLDNNANFATVPYIIDEFTNVWETAFGILDPNNFDCLVNRTKGDTSTEMFMINHFLDKPIFNQIGTAPDIANLNRTNAASGSGSLGEHVTTCQVTQNRPPNFMLVNYYEFGGGSVFEVAANINGVPYSPEIPIATPLAPSVTSSSLNSASFLDHNQIFACILSIMAVMIGMLLVL
jgi:hypothetical protein